MRSLRIAVVGAGIAGLTCARRLRAAGHEVDVFDKGRAPSGRVATRRADGFAFDHGAQYCTVRDPLFAEQVEAWVRDGTAGEWKGRFGTLRAGAVEAGRGSTVRYVGRPGMSALARALARDLRLHASTRVERIGRSPDGWRLHDDTGRELGRFDVTLVTAPAPQAATLLALVPELARRAAGVPMQPCWAVLAGFGGDLEAPVDGAFVVDSPLSWVARNSSKPDRPTAESWVLHAGPEWSRAHLDLEGEAVTQRLLAALGEALGRPLPAPAYVAGHRWRYASPDPSLEERCLFDPDERVGAAGDWCGGPRVEGAFLSGAALARALLERT